MVASVVLYGLQQGGGVVQQYAIYVHIPFCKSRCGYCVFSSCTNYQLCQQYFNKLFQEIEDQQVVADSQISTVFVGGGTPTSVPSEMLQKLFEVLNTKFDLSTATEITVECNPESATLEMLSTLKQCGVNRLSFGLQSVNDSTLSRVGRAHNFQQFLTALHNAKKLGFHNVNADLIVGLPESRQDFFHTVETVSLLPLSHVSLYSLELHEHAPIYQLCTTDFVFSDDQLADMYDYAMNKLQQTGFVRYEVSNFAKKGMQCKHNVNYWTEGRYYGFGASAHCFVQNVRKSNVFSIHDYISKQNVVESTEIISLQEEASEFVMLTLRLVQGFSVDDFQRRFGLDFCQQFPQSAKLLEGGFLQQKDGRIFVPSNKFYVLNSILAELL